MQSERNTKENMHFCYFEITKKFLFSLRVQEAKIDFAGREDSVCREQRQCLQGAKIGFVNFWRALKEIRAVAKRNHSGR
jgi:hypothetical protein